MASERGLSTKETRFSKLKRSNIKNYFSVIKDFHLTWLPIRLATSDPVNLSPTNAAVVGSLIARCDLYLNSLVLAGATPQNFPPISAICGLDHSLQLAGKDFLHYNHDKTEFQVYLGVIESAHACLILCKFKSSKLHRSYSKKRIREIYHSTMQWTSSSQISTRCTDASPWHNLNHVPLTVYRSCLPIPCKWWEPPARFQCSVIEIFRLTWLLITLAMSDSSELKCSYCGWSR